MGEMAVVAVALAVLALAAAGVAGWQCWGALRRFLASVATQRGRLQGPVAVIQQELAVTATEADALRVGLERSRDDAQRSLGSGRRPGGRSVPDRFGEVRAVD